MNKKKTTELKTFNIATIHTFVHLILKQLYKNTLKIQLNKQNILLCKTLTDLILTNKFSWLLHQDISEIMMHCQWSHQFMATHFLSYVKLDYQQLKISLMIFDQDKTNKDLQNLFGNFQHDKQKCTQLIRDEWDRRWSRIWPNIKVNVSQIINLAQTLLELNKSVQQS